jgi:NAD(P)H-dependent FMN reductase
MKSKIAIIYGSVRTKRQGIKGVKYLADKCRERGLEVLIVDPLEFNLPLIDKMYKEYKNDEAPENLKKLSQIFSSVDGFIVVSGEYNHSIPPALTNLMDYFQSEYYFKPSAIACYSAGAYGGVRAAMQLRMFLSELGTPSIPTLFVMPKIGQSFDSEGRVLDESYEKRVKKFFDEFEWYLKAFKSSRESGTPY